MEGTTYRTGIIVLQPGSKNPCLSGKIFLIQSFITLGLLPVRKVCFPVTVCCLLPVYFQTLCFFQMALQLSVLFKCLFGLKKMVKMIFVGMKQHVKLMALMR